MGLDSDKQIAIRDPSSVSKMSPKRHNPSTWLTGYSDFIIKNASAVSQIESALRSLTYIIPGRFKEAELASESLHSSIQLLSLYHDSLLHRALSNLAPQQRPQLSPHNRYTRHWTTKSPTYARLALLLQMIKHTELLWEMLAKRKSPNDTTRWRVIILLEVVKAVCRLVLLKLTGSRPLLSPPLPEREVDPQALEESVGKSEEEQIRGQLEDKNSVTALDRPLPSMALSTDPTTYHMPRTGLTLPPLPSSTTPSDLSTYLLSKVLTADDIKPPSTLLHRLTSPKATLAEILYILRPVIYAAAMAHYTSTSNGGSKKDWRPWVIGVSLEYGARQLAKQDFQQRLHGGMRGLTGLEREELRKRGWALGWWAMRGAFYENVTRNWIASLVGSLRNKPILDMAGGIVDDYLVLWDQYYFPTASL